MRPYCTVLIFKNKNDFITLLNTIFGKSQNEYPFITVHYNVVMPTFTVAFKIKDFSSVVFFYYYYLNKIV